MTPPNTPVQSGLLWLCVAFLLVAHVAYWLGYTDHRQATQTAALCPNPDEVAYAKVTRTPLDTTECK